MNVKGIISMVLVAFVAVSVAYMVFQETSAAPHPQAPEGNPAEAVATGHSGSSPSEVAEAGGGAGATEVAAPSSKVIAYYLHWTMRCRTCLTIEKQAEEALRTAFPDAFADGTLEWRAVDVQEPAYAQLAQKFELVTSSLILVHFRDGVEDAWVNLEKVWQLVSDAESFGTYVVTETRHYLES